MMSTLVREARRLWTYRWQIWLDTAKDLVSDNRETVGRLLWVVLLPLVPMGLYLFLAKIRVFPPHDAIHGVAYVMAGALLWFLYAGLFLAPFGALKRKAKVAAQSRYPISGVILSGALYVLVEFCVRCIFVAAVLAFTQAPDFWGVVGLLGVVAPLGLFFLGAGTVLAVFSVAWKDLERVATISVQYLFFLSNVLFTLPERVVPHWLVWCNPFAFAIDTGRWYLMFGELPNVWLWVGWSVAGVLIAAKALSFVADSEQRVAAHL